MKCSQLYLHLFIVDWCEENRKLYGFSHDNIIYYVPSMTDCVTHCLEATHIYCQSVQYRYAGPIKKCIINADNKYSRPELYGYSSEGYTYCTVRNASWGKCWPSFSNFLFSPSNTIMGTNDPWMDATVSSKIMNAATVDTQIFANI